MGGKSSSVSSRWSFVVIIGCNQDAAQLLMMALGFAMAPVRGHAAASCDAVAWVSSGRRMTRLRRSRGESRLSSPVPGTRPSAERLLQYIRR